MKERLKAGIKSAKINTIFSFLVSIMGFFKFRIFLVNYGSEINGIYQLFTQMVAYFMVADFGLNGAFTVHMYKTIVNEDYIETSKLYNGCKKIIGLTSMVMLIILVAISFFMPLINEKFIGNHGLILLFIFFSLPIVYRQMLYPLYSLLDARLKTYKYELVNHLIGLSKMVTSILMLINRVEFGIVIIVESIVEMILITFDYIYLRELNKEYINVSSESDYAPASMTKYLFLNKISYTLINSTDNLIVTKYRGFSDLSIFSLYMYISNTLLSIISPILWSFAGGFGNLFAYIENKGTVHKEDGLESIEIFQKICFYLALFICLCLSFGTRPFVKLYSSGADIAYTINNFELLIFQMFFFINIYHTPDSIYVNVLGKYKETCGLLVFEGVLNLVISIILINKMGLFGVLLGTVIARLFIRIPNFCRSLKFSSALKRFCGFFSAMFILIIANYLNSIALTKLFINNYLKWIFIMIIYSTAIIIFIFIIMDKKTKTVLLLHFKKEIKNK